MATVLVRCYWKQRARKAREKLIPMQPCPTLATFRRDVASVWGLDPNKAAIRMRAQTGDHRPCVLNSDAVIASVWRVASALGTMRVQIHVMQSLGNDVALRRVRNSRNLFTALGQVSFKYQVGQTLGRTRIAVMKLCLNTTTGGFVVMQSLPVRMRAQVEKEAAVLMAAPHQHVARVIGVDVNVPGEVRLFTEYVPGGTIASFLRRFGSLEEGVIQQYVRQCVLAIHHLHCNEIAHRDVNVENIMVASDGTIKLAGIGTGSLSDEIATPTATGSALARAMAVDIWDLGLVVLDMALGIKSGRGHRDHYPCPELVHGRFGAGAGAGGGAGASDGASASAADMLDVVPPVPAFLSADATKFVVSCLIPKASVRPSAEELLSMPFVQEAASATSLTDGAPLLLCRRPCVGPPSVVCYRTERPASPQTRMRMQLGSMTNNHFTKEFWEALGKAPPAQPAAGSNVLDVTLAQLGATMVDYDSSPSTDEEDRGQSNEARSERRGSGRVPRKSSAASTRSGGSRRHSARRSDAPQQQVDVASAGGSARSIATNNSSRHSVVAGASPRSSVGGAPANSGPQGGAPDAPVGAREQQRPRSQTVAGPPHHKPRAALASMPSRLETMGYTLGGALSPELSGAEEGGDSDGLEGTQNELMGTGSFDEDSHNRSKSWNQARRSASDRAVTRHDNGAADRSSALDSQPHVTPPSRRPIASLPSRLASNIGDSPSPSPNPKQPPKWLPSTLGEDNDRRQEPDNSEGPHMSQDSDVISTPGDGDGGGAGVGVTRRKREFAINAGTASSAARTNSVSPVDGDNMALTDAWDMVDLDKRRGDEPKPRKVVRIADNVEIVGAPAAAEARPSATTSEPGRHRSQAQRQFIMKFATRHEASEHDLLKGGAGASSSLDSREDGKRPTIALAGGMTGITPGVVPQDSPDVPAGARGGYYGTDEDDSLVLTDAWDMVDLDKKRRAKVNSTDQRDSSKRSGRQLQFLRQFESQAEDDRAPAGGDSEQGDVTSLAARARAARREKAKKIDEAANKRAKGRRTSLTGVDAVDGAPMGSDDELELERALRSQVSASSDDPLVLTDAWDMVDLDKKREKKRTPSRDASGRSGPQLQFLRQFQTQHEGSSRDLLAPADDVADAAAATPTTAPVPGPAAVQPSISTPAERVGSTPRPALSGMTPEQLEQAQIAMRARAAAAALARAEGHTETRKPAQPKRPARPSDSIAAVLTPHLGSRDLSGSAELDASLNALGSDSQEDGRRVGTRHSGSTVSKLASSDSDLAGAGAGQSVAAASARESGRMAAQRYVQGRNSRAPRLDVDAPPRRGGVCDFGGVPAYGTDIDALPVGASAASADGTATPQVTGVASVTPTAGSRRGISAASRPRRMSEPAALGLGASLREAGRRASEQVTPVGGSVAGGSATSLFSNSEHDSSNAWTPTSGAKQAAHNAQRQRTARAAEARKAEQDAFVRAYTSKRAIDLEQDTQWASPSSRHIDAFRAGAGAGGPPGPARPPLARAQSSKGTLLTTPQDVSRLALRAKVLDLGNAHPREAALAHSNSTAPTLPSQSKLTQQQARRRLSESDTLAPGAGASRGIAAEAPQERPASRSSQVARKLSKLLDPRQWKWGGKKRRSRRTSTSGQSADSLGGGSARSAHTTSSSDSGGRGLFMHHHPPDGVGVSAESLADSPQLHGAGTIIRPGDHAHSSVDPEYSPVTPVNNDTYHQVEPPSPMAAATRGARHDLARPGFERPPASAMRVSTQLSHEVIGPLEPVTPTAMLGGFGRRGYTGDRARGPPGSSEDLTRGSSSGSLFGRLPGAANPTPAHAAMR